MIKPIPSGPRCSAPSRPDDLWIGPHEDDITPSLHLHPAASVQQFVIPPLVREQKEWLGIGVQIITVNTPSIDSTRAQLQRQQGRFSAPNLDGASLYSAPRMSSAPSPLSTDTQRGFAWAICLAVLAMVPVVLWPGDVSFLIDEPRLLAMAWHANHDGVLATAGLAGNFGVRYGPLAVQVYQALLLITHDPYALVILRGLLCGGVTAFGLLWLARTLNLPAWFAAAVLVAPLVVTYQRVLWDASFALPVGTLALAALADFIVTRRPRSLRICFVATLLVPLIHPQGLPLFLAIGGWLVWQQRKALWRDLGVLLVLATLLLALNGMYFVSAAGDVWWRLHHAAATYPGTGSRWASALAPFLGGNLLAGVAAVHEPLSEPLLTLALWSSRVIYPLTWLGMALVGRRALAAGRIGQGILVRDKIAMVALAGLAMQALLFGALRIPCGPQYFFGTFPLHVFFAWMGMDLLRSWRLHLAVGTLYAVGGAMLTLGTMLAVHRDGYAETGWPRLRESVDVVHELNRFADAEVHTDVPFYAKHSEPLRALRLLLPPLPGETTRLSGLLLVTRRTTMLTGGDEIAVLDLTGKAPLPPSTAIEVSPLPRGWIPPADAW